MCTIIQVKQEILHLTGFSKCVLRGQLEMLAFREEEKTLLLLCFTQDFVLLSLNNSGCLTLF